MKIIPQDDYCACTLEESKNTLNGSVVIIDNKDIPRYKIVETSRKMEKESAYHVGDIILTNSQPTKFVVDDVSYYMIKEEFIAGKLM